MAFGREDLLRRFKAFAVKVIALSNRLPRTASGFVIAQQVIGSGTSVGSNTVEAQDASSRRDFISKMSIALRECKESEYWLSIIKATKLLAGQDLEDLITEAGELCAIYSAIVKNAKKNS